MCWGFSKFAVLEAGDIQILFAALQTLPAKKTELQ